MKLAHFRLYGAIAVIGAVYSAACGQATKTPAQSTALDTPAAQASSDQSATGSPVPSAAKRSSIRIGTSISVLLANTISSASQKNGDTVHARLAQAVRPINGPVLAPGTSVEATVVSSAKAGTISSGGVLSLQLTRIGGLPVISDVLDFNGQEGHKDVADSAPQTGTQAEVPGGTVLRFRILDDSRVPGVIPGIAPATNAGGASGGGAGTTPNAQQQPPTGSPNTAPGVNQTPIQGATQGVSPPAQPATPKNPH